MNYIEAVNNIEEGAIELKPVKLIKTSIYQAISGIEQDSTTILIPSISNPKETITPGDSIIYFLYVMVETQIIKAKAGPIKITNVESNNNGTLLELAEPIDLKGEFVHESLSRIMDIQVNRETIKEIQFKKVSRDGLILENRSESSSTSYLDKIIAHNELYTYNIEGIKIIGENDTVIFDNLSDEVLFAPDFEDIFLTDATRNYRVLYNPKISSFKTVIAEQKIDTIGGRFPLFVRNGNLNYKEIPISGLIVAPQEVNTETKRDYTPASGMSEKAIKEAYETLKIDYQNRIVKNQTPGEKIAAERAHREEIEQWLRNGMPKLFRSPTEGNYIIRLMNVSLSPNDTLGRMLYSFSATGYEIMEYNEENAYNLCIKPIEEELPSEEPETGGEE